MISKLGKVAGLALFVFLLGAVLVVMTNSSQKRARMRYCQNNCRELGRAGANEVFYGPGFESENFWQEIRITLYRIDRYRDEPDPEKVSPEECREHPCPDSNHLHEWKPKVRAYTFLCPVYGKTKFAPNDPEAIDYRGPRAIPDLYQQEGRAILGADRERNHPDGGGFVIFADSSVAKRKSEVLESPDGSALWKEAAQSLRD